MLFGVKGTVILQACFYKNSTFGSSRQGELSFPSHLTLDSETLSILVCTQGFTDSIGKTSIVCVTIPSPLNSFEGSTKAFITHSGVDFLHNLRFSTTKFHHLQTV